MSESDHVLPGQVEAFFEAQGWEKRDSSKLRSTWVRVIEDELAGHLSVPTVVQAPDYEELLSLAVRRYADVEGVEARYVWEDLHTRRFDTVRIRLMGGLFDRGRAPLGEAFDLFKAAKDLFYAGAAFSESPKPFFRGGKTENVRSFLDSLQVAAPNKGSFVVKVLVPVEPELAEFNEEIAPNNPLPFSRQATAATLRSVDATIEAAHDSRKTNSMKPFANAVDRGVSANVCEALGDLASQGLQTSVELSTSWAISRVGESTIPHRRVVPGDLMSLVRKAAPLLRGHQLPEPIVVVGHVFLLHEEKAKSKHTVGIYSSAPDVPRKVRVTLSKLQYERAVQACAKKSVVRAVGELSRHGNVAYIDKPDEFDIIFEGETLQDHKPRRSKLSQFGLKEE